MKEYFFSGLLLPFAFLSGCAMPVAQPGATASGSSASRSSAAEYRTVWVAPPVGSLLGGGFVPAADNVQGSSEGALLATINQPNAASERPFAVAGVSGAIGMTERELQSRQDRLQLRFGELCATNPIARGKSNKVHEIAALESKDPTSTEVATANGMSTPAAEQTAHNANQTTVNSSSNGASRATGSQGKLKNLVVRPKVPPGG